MLHRCFSAGIAVAIILSRRPKQQEFSFPAAGGTLTPLTTDPGYEGEPTFSPDGETVAYVSDREGNYEIYIQQVSGGAAINLTRNASADIQPAFSPDGRQIAFVSDRAGVSDVFAAGPLLPLVGGDIWVMPALGGACRRIVEQGNFPAWSPDGRWIVYTHGTFRQSHIAVVSAEGGKPRDLEITDLPVARLFYPTFSSDGKWILFQNGGSVNIVPSQGGKAHFLVLGAGPRWGPGSRSVIFTNLERGKNRTLWQAPFSTELGKLAGPALPLTFGRGSDFGATVSADGRSVVFSAQDESLNLEELPIDSEEGRITGPPHSLTLGSNRVNLFSPAPDGNSVVFTAERGATSHLWRIDSSSTPVQLTLDPEYSDTDPSWSPDGARIAFLRSMTGKEGNRQLWMISPDGANPRQLMEVSGQIAWLDSKHILAQQGKDNLAVIDADNSATSILPFRVRTLFAIDRKNGWLAYQTADRGNVDITAVPIAGGKPKVVVATPKEDYHPSFSPSGRWLYFQPNHKNLYRVPGPAQQWRSAPPERVTNFPEAGLYLEDPQISPTGTKLFYTRGRTVGDLWLIRFPDPIAGPPRQ